MKHRPDVILDAIIALLRDKRKRTATEIASELSPKIDRTHATIYTTISQKAAHDRRIARERVRVRKGFSVYVYGLSPEGEAA
jgi:predicted transcriptional regulator